MESALESIKDSYDVDTLRDIAEHGCSSGLAHSHIYYDQCGEFFDNYEDEIIEYIADQLGGEFNEQLWIDNPCNPICYKNETVWTYIDLVAQQLVEEYESTTNEELSNLDGSVYEELKELSNTEWGKNHLEIVTL